MAALVADEAMAQRLLAWLLPDGDPLVALSAAEVERFCWYELPCKWHADPLSSGGLSPSWPTC
ncbi:hypothetical protein F9278_28415 [Streptomyces phaeolivaceus]|uniref:Uncharacterized protein n=1 Tax=Streptomyces phaeolivaceus TaxID=2653200 RepID=A0A5P8K8U0_9ACTN|nr:hypothetical protein [Streptomyces phaeolivaceus]QFQ99426.1 hypothetical protein F9278_28415 [Streptomyces phaeolivaceus]